MDKVSKNSARLSFFFIPAAMKLKKTRKAARSSHEQ